MGLNSFIIGWSIVWGLSILSLGLVEFHGMHIVLQIIDIKTIRYSGPIYVFIIWAAGCGIIVLTSSAGKYLSSKSLVPKVLKKKGDKPKSLDESERVVINCIHCGKKLKIPCSEKAIIITCPHCDQKFQFRVDPKDQYQFENSEAHAE